MASATTTDEDNNDENKSTSTSVIDPKAPANANTGCVGPTSQSAGKASACAGCPNQGACSSGAMNSPEALAAAEAETQSLQASLANVSHVILVLSGKGGVGKSTVAAQLAHTLSGQGYAVGLLDVDLCGPSAPRMILGNACTTQTIQKSGENGSLWLPVYANNNANLAVMSISFMLQDANQAVVWRGPRKNALIQQFLTQVDWTGETDGLDYLIVDTPPGTSDEHISTVQYLQRANAVSGAIVVTTPEEVSLADVRKELNFCQKTNVPVLGIVENMSSYQTRLDQLKFLSKDGETDCTETVIATLKEKCPGVLECLVSSELFSVATTGGAGSAAGAGAQGMAADYNIPFWGRLPMDPDLLRACEHGQSFVATHPQAAAAKALVDFCLKINKCLPVDMAH